MRLQGLMQQQANYFKILQSLLMTLALLLHRLLAQLFRFFSIPLMIFPTPALITAR
jgi:hypothetical protein